MAYKCIESTYVGRLFEEGMIYDSIGKAKPSRFVEVEVDDRTPVVETGLAPVEDLEREEILAELKELGVSFKPRAKTDTLKGLLEEARQASLLA
jgi:hypothetical protein